MDRIRSRSRGVARLTGSVCAAWLILAAGAGHASAQSSPGAAPKGPAKAKQAKTTAAMPAAMPAQAPRPFEGSPNSSANVQVTEHLTVDLHVQDEDLANVLQMLSLQSQRNIVVSKDVSATVSANLYNVTFYEALDAILNVNGYGYLERGNFIFVYTLEELAEIEQAARQPVSKVIRLNYLNANDAAEFVSPLLSEVGQIKTNGDVDSFSLSEKTPKGDETFALSATLVVYDYPEHIEEIEKLVTQLDTRPSQVLVEATILQSRLNEANAFGIDFSVIGDVEFTDFLNPLSAAQALILGDQENGFQPPDNRGQAATSTVGNTADPRSTFKLGVISDDVSVFLRLLDEVTDITILSSPKVLALNRQPGRVLVGQRLGYVNTTVTETASIPKVEFLNTGVQLAFRPFISNDGMIRLELTPSVSTGQVRTIVGQQGSPLTIPDEDARELSTNVLVRDGNTVVLGGLFTESTTLNRRQIPVLGDIPLVGAAFRGHDDETARSEVIFLIKPTIMNDQSLIEGGERALAWAEDIRVGARSGLLPFSRDRQTAILNVEAEELAAQGKNEEALWKVRRSLELNPVQPDAIRLRERLMGTNEAWPSRSALENVLDVEVEKRLGAIRPALDKRPVAARHNDRSDVALAAAKSRGSGSEPPAASFDGQGKQSVSVASEQPKVKADGVGDLKLTATLTPSRGSESFVDDPFGPPTGSARTLGEQRQAALWAMPFFMGDPSLATLAGPGMDAGFTTSDRPVAMSWWQMLQRFPSFGDPGAAVTTVPSESEGN